MTRKVTRKQNRRDKPGDKSFEMSGGAERDRTVDLLNAIQALSQLSYSPIKDLPEAQGGPPEEGES